MGQPRRLGLGFSLAVVCALSAAAVGQQEKHGRGYKAPPPTATVLVTVEKTANGKPLANASVIFRAVKDESLSANLEMKTDPEGHASIDLLEVGSHITVQVIAGGYATYASDFDLTAEGKQLLVKLQRPRAQVSVYGEGADRPADMHPGVQEKPKAGDGSAGATAPGSKAPLPAAPPAPTPAAVPGSSATPSAPSTSSVPGPRP